MEDKHKSEFCKTAFSLNPGKPEDQKAILALEKHALIEGSCVEAAFIDDVLADSFASFSTNWWVTQRNSGYRLIKITDDIAQLTAIDLELLKFFHNKNVPVFVAAFDEGEKCFFYAEFEPWEGLNFVALWERIRKRLPPQCKPCRLPPSELRTPDLHRSATDLLERMRLLRNVAVERLFVNCCIGARYPLDIDVLTFHKGKVFAFEVKHKDLSQSGCFGLNRKPSELFSFLSGLGVRVIYVILTKPARNIPVTALYTNKIYQQHSLWVAANYSKDILPEQTLAAPSYTGVSGRHGIAYYPIAVNHFHRLKHFGGDAPDALLNFINGGTQALSSTSGIPKL
jgi:hypothetical protein